MLLSVMSFVTANHPHPPSMRGNRPFSGPGSVLFALQSRRGFVEVRDSPEKRSEGDESSARAGVTDGRKKGMF